jgi:hypothetical protein
VQDITAENATSNKPLREQLNKGIRALKSCWRRNSKHYSNLSATCDHAHMPRELLPRLGANNTVMPDKLPYLTQSTINDVKAMRYIRSAHASRSYATMWATLQARLQQFATTGAGTVAEAIVANDYWWNGQLAHELPSGGRSKAMKRRYSKTK